MLSELIEKLRQDGLAVDSQSLADTLWLADTMSLGSVLADVGQVALEREVNWQSIPERPPEVDEFGTHKPSLTTVEVPDRVNHKTEKALLQPTSAHGKVGETATLGALPTLHNRMGFKRAVKPFLAQHRQASAKVDERLTLDRLADDGLQALEPVFLPGSRRSLRVSLIRERSGSNALWTQPLDELAQLFRVQGAFKQQREWVLGEAEPMPDGLPGAAVLAEFDRRGRQLADPRQADKIKWWPGEILLVASDFTSAGWRNGAYSKLLQVLAQRQPLVLLHTLPKRLWSRSWTGNPDAWVSSAQPLVATRAMEVRVQSYGRTPVRDDKRLAIPLIEFAPAQLKAWANGVVGGAGRLPAILLDEREPEPYGLAPAGGERNASVLAMQFRMASSAVTRSLAQQMSVTAPLSFPVMRWVQQAMLPDSDTSHLAEFVLGGLLEALPCPPGTPADEVTYDFVPGVRPLLQQGMPKALGLDIQRHVGHYLEHTHSAELDMRAVVQTWSEEQIRQLSPEQQAFAEVSRAFLERIGLRARSTVENSEVQNDTKTMPPELAPQDDEWGPEVGGSVIALGAAAYSRVYSLREPILDLQWSPSGDDRLMVRMASAISVWQPGPKAFGRTVRRQQGIDGVQEPVMTILWWAPSDDRGDTAAKIIARRVTDALRDSLSARLRVRRLSNPLLLERRRINAQAFIVFQTEGYQAWADEHYEQFHAIERFVLRNDVVSTCLIMGAQPAAHPAINRPSRIKERFNLKAATHFEPHVWRELESLTRRLRERLLQRFPQPYQMMRLTGASWLSGNQLGVAEYDGNFTRVNLLNVADLGHESAVESQLLALHPGQPPLTHLFRVPEVAKSLEVADNLFALDCNGATYRKDGIEFLEIIPGAGLPRRPVSSTGSRRWWVTGEGATLVADPDTREPALVDVPLLPNRGGRLDEDLQALLHDQVLSAWTRDDTVFAITAAGLLHRGSLYDLLGSNRKRPRSLDQEPVSLSGSLRAASVSADGRRLVTVASSGLLDLWETEGFKRLRSWQVAASISSARHVGVALSANGKHIAFASGKIVRVIEEPLPVSIDKREFRQVLWVDDRPWNNEGVRKHLASRAIGCTLALDTREALQLLETRRFAAIISDMGRMEGPKEGYRLLDAVRERGDSTPFFIYAGSDSAEHREQALRRGAQGSSNNPLTLLVWVTEQVDKAAANSQGVSGQPD